ncbi:tuzin, putative [Trypanosoma equiperdum]|uniref:Tuzin n=3 Tax=Trypanozoon TaxID=39700 RepID=Q585L1_TRYB2|nr:tuzin, putative [Trypanosoma brucei gambiense DAL972]XP_844489.1 tuzin [Trypanosoma brucei brucei TREU927]AAX79195.1 tuzin [Trypanosoma brucei]SCU69139.1 tuzin, putative [Trypanosoma equiperdum]AAZ10930.1 tuzin [Trypanosoma brucei brucei TREU927]CBH10639.1 tuzin, putative [Trypanosoma brucei gambiense DAL972]|eukprot:XP_011772927.1 tuzin, putative [Trypanosoma brucei gambiense DAL972]
MWRRTWRVMRIASASASRTPPTASKPSSSDVGISTSTADCSRDAATQMSLQGLGVAAYFRNSETASTDEPIAIGHITAQISESVYAVFFKEIALSPVIEVGSRVYVSCRKEAPTPKDSTAPDVLNHSNTSNTSGNEITAPVNLSSPKGEGVEQQPVGGAEGSAGAAVGGGGGGGGGGGTTAPVTAGPFCPYSNGGGTIIGGLVAKVNGNGTFGVLLDDDRFDLAVPREVIMLSEGRSKFISNEKFQEVLEWVKSAGVDRRSDQESTSCILYHRGWRADKLYLLESADVHCLSHLNKSVRMSVLEKSEWERDQHRHRREEIKERMKEKELRYVLTKYSGVFSACVAVLGVMSVFGWNFKNYTKQQRSYQLAIAANTLSQRTVRHPIKGTVPREAEEQRVRQILRQQDVTHPRIIVFSGFHGCGKSSLVRSAIRKEKMAAVLVDIRANEDPVRSIVKSLGVQNIEACGDLLDFIVDASERAKKAMNGVSPLFVVKLCEGSSLMRVYNELVALACDRRLCHVVIEVPIESLTLAMTALPRLDFHLIPNFSVGEAFRYTNHMIDPLEFLNFVEVAGTNSNDIDELFATVQHGRMSASAYTNQKLVKAMRQLEAAWSKDPSLREAVINLAKFPFEAGQREGYDYSSLRSEALRDIVMYNPVSDVWMFHQKVFHTAARCWQ